MTEPKKYVVKYNSSTLPDGHKYTAHPSRIIPLEDSIELPDLPYQLRQRVDEILEKQIKDGKKLSDIQMESILYCHARHEATLYNGLIRHAFLLGDSTGTGKGRQIAGLFILNILLGRKGPHFWFSKDANLIVDAQKALTDVSMKHQIISHQQPSNTKPQPSNTKPQPSNTKPQPSNTKPQPSSTGPVIYLYKYGKSGNSQEIKNGNGLIYFMTYGNAKKKEIDEIIKGSNNENRVIVFDECHETNGNGKWGENIKRLTDGIPLARILYASATPFNGVNNLSYLQRIMLDVDLTKIKSKNDKNEILRCHLITRWLRGKGYYVSRTIDPATSIYRLQELQLNIVMVEQYRLLSYLYNRLLIAYDPTTASTGDSKSKSKSKAVTVGKKSTVGNEFWARVNSHFFSPIIANFKVDGVVNLVETEGNGLKNLIVFSNTNETVLDEAEYSGSLINVKFKRMLSMSPLGKHDFNQWFPYIHTTLNSLDQYLSLFGKRVLLVSSKTSQYRYKDDNSTDIVKVEGTGGLIRKELAIEDFNNQDIDILLMGKSLSTGASLHRNNNKEKQRFMVLTQFNEYIEQFLQTIGRVQRTSNVTDGRHIATIVSAILPIASEYIKLNATHNKLRILSSSRGSFNPQEFIDLLGENKNDYSIQIPAYNRIMLIYEGIKPLLSIDKTCILRGYQESLSILEMEYEAQLLIKNITGGSPYLDPGDRLPMTDDDRLTFCKNAIKEIIDILSIGTPDKITLQQFLSRLIMLPFGYQNLIFNIFKQFIEIDGVKTGDVSIDPIPGIKATEEIFKGNDNGVTTLIRYTIMVQDGVIRYVYGGEFWMYYININDYRWASYSVNGKIYHGLTTMEDADNVTSTIFKKSIENEFIRLFVTHNQSFLNGRYIRDKTILRLTDGYPLSWIKYLGGEAMYCKEKNYYKVTKNGIVTYYPESTVIDRRQDKLIVPTVATVIAPTPSSSQTIVYEFKPLSTSADIIMKDGKCDDILTVSSGKIEHGRVTQI